MDITSERVIRGQEAFQRSTDLNMKVQGRECSCRVLESFWKGEWSLVTRYSGAGIALQITIMKMISLGWEEM